MRTYAALLLVLILLPAIPAHAATLSQGSYEFEDCGADCTLSGTWVVSFNGAQEFIVGTSAPSDYVEFNVIGKTLTIYRIVASGFASMQVCVNASCATVANSGATGNLDAPYTVPLTGGVDTIRITGNNVYLDYFIVLDEAGGGGVFPTPVPTATILPSSTPAPSTTPAPTATPQPTTTPISLVWALDPASRYHNIGTQMVKIDYSISVADVVLGMLIFGMLLTVMAKIFMGRK